MKKLTFLTLLMLLLAAFQQAQTQVAISVRFVPVISELFVPVISVQTVPLLNKMA